MDFSTALSLATRLVRRDEQEDEYAQDTVRCPDEPKYGDEIEVIRVIGNLHFHQLAIIIAAAAGGLACIISFILIFRHATHYSAPGEQKQIMRVALLVQWFVLVSIISVIFEPLAPYLKPLLLIGESFTIASFLLFLCNCVLSNEGGFEKMFAVHKHEHLHHLRHEQRRYSHMRTVNYTGPTWLRGCWYLAMQLIPVSFIVLGITVASKATGHYCNTSNSFLFSKSWIAWIENISIALAVAGEVGFHFKQADELRPHGAWRKLLAFKSIVILNVIQLTTISALAGNRTINPSKYLSWNDLVYGLPNLMICCEMPFFALLFLFTYRIAPYRITEADDPREYRGGRFGIVAFAEALNITDILSTFVRGPIQMLKHQELMVEKHGLDLEAIAQHKSTPYLSRATSRATTPAASIFEQDRDEEYSSSRSTLQESNNHDQPLRGYQRQEQPRREYPLHEQPLREYPQDHHPLREYTQDFPLQEQPLPGYSQDYPLQEYHRRDYTLDESFLHEPDYLESSLRGPRRREPTLREPERALLNRSRSRAPTHRQARSRSRHYSERTRQSRAPRGRTSRSPSQSRRREHPNFVL